MIQLLTSSSLQLFIVTLFTKCLNVFDEFISNLYNLPAVCHTLFTNGIRTHYTLLRDEMYE
jgi:hypothetical protein